MRPGSASRSKARQQPSPKTAGKTAALKSAQGASSSKSSGYNKTTCDHLFAPARFVLHFISMTTVCWTVCRPRARALELVKKHAPEHLVSTALHSGAGLCSQAVQSSPGDGAVPVFNIRNISLSECCTGHSQEDQMGG